MQDRDQTNTLLQAQDLLATLNCLGRPPLDALRRRAKPPRLLPHDFLVPNLRPDLTPDWLAATTAEGAQSWERNMPQK